MDAHSHLRGPLSGPRSAVLGRRERNLTHGIGERLAGQHSEEDRPVGNAFCGARSVVHVDMMCVFSKGIIDGEAKSAGSSGVVQSGCEESS